MRNDAVANSLKKKEVDISVLQAELAKWQDRVPPLVERYRQRDLEAQRLEIELQKANGRVAVLEEQAGGDHTRMELEVTADFRSRLSKHRFAATTCGGK